MFTGRDYRIFIISGVLIVAGYGCMLYDPVAYGFGPLTRWVAPPLLLAGFILPLAGILGAEFFYRISWFVLRAGMWKHLPAFIIFGVALTTYLVTLEPTASLWDCPEFIASAYKLQVPHTPGTPLSLLVGRIFTMFAGNVSRVALCMNAMSGFFSALTVCLVFYLLLYLGENMVLSRPVSRRMLVLAAACGSLCLTFSDSFWFSAVEAETYGGASFFLVLLLWLILQGSEQHGDLRMRWLVLIFYVAGLGYCIHPMSVLTLPLLPLVWYTRGRKLTWLNVSLTMLAGLALVFFINRFVAVGVFELAFSWDVFLVNVLHLPFYSGLVVLLAVMSIAVGWIAFRYINTRPYIWAAVFLLAGFLPYVMLFIRSAHNPPIDEGNPEDLPLSKAYMNRESYPTSPLITGPFFDAQITSITAGKRMYYKTPGGYRPAGTMSDYHYDPARTTILPRLYSNDPAHIASYRAWTGLREGEAPTLRHSIRFLFEYQLGYMYFRYFLWNFAGRAGDEQGSDWLKPWDPLRVASYTYNHNRARNQYWMIPLLLGFLGMIIQAEYDRKNFLNTLFFFLLTGMVLVLYLNSPPSEPRERDYIYVGSYVAFVLWTGLGVRYLVSFLPQRWSWAGVVLLAVPAWMCFENADDHNRSGRTLQMDSARNVLDSCEPNAILFTGGDNDTFPLWYLQDVEGFRTDVRVVVLSYFNTDWYVNQLRRAYYSSPAFALTLSEDDYRQYGPNDALYLREVVKGGVDVQEFLKLIRSGHGALRMISSTGDPYTIIPSSILTVKTNSTVQHADSLYEPLPQISFKVTGNYMTKNALAFLDVLVSNGWRRPIYFNFTSLHGLDLNLTDHVVQEGLVYRLAPVENRGNEPLVDTRRAYRNLIERADYSNLMDSQVYFNYEDFQARIIAPSRMAVNDLAAACLRQDNKSMAGKVLQVAMEKLYPRHLDPGYAGLQTAGMLLTVGRSTQARSLSARVFDFHYDKIQISLLEGRPVDKLDRYLAQESAGMLQQLGDGQYMTRFAGLSY